MVSLDWSQTVTIPAQQVAAAQQYDRNLRHAIWIFSRLPYIVIALLALIIWFVWWRVQRRRARALSRSAAASA